MDTQQNRKKPWPFVGNSLFVVDPAHCQDDRQVFDHVLNMLRTDFKIEDDKTDPRFQVLLSEVVSLYTRKAVLMSNVPEDEVKEILRDKAVENLDDKISKSLRALMEYTNDKRIKAKVSVENLID